MFGAERAALRSLVTRDYDKGTRPTSRPLRGRCPEPVSAPGNGRMSPCEHGVNVDHR